VTGARGVIINVTGGEDLSLIEVSDASTIVQEAADEDANIIFGAVVDPTVKGKVKITVIATGFGPMVAAKPVTAAAQTPVDMTPYADVARLRPEPPVVPVAPLPLAPQPRLTLTRRTVLDLPLAANGGASGTALPGGPAGEPGGVELAPHFDVPAFLRRQEG
jgi:cell division protein FtsZ